MHREYLRKTIEDCQRRGDRYYGYRGGWPAGDIESEQFKRMCRAFDVDPDGWWPVVT